MNKNIAVLLASAEIRGIYGTGGLADVAAALAKAVNGKENCTFETDLIMPVLRPEAKQKVGELEKKGNIKAVTTINVPLDGIYYEVIVHETNLPGNNTKVFLLKSNIDVEKNSVEEAVFFSRCVCEFCKQKAGEYQIIHCNDWNTGLIPIYLKKLYTNLNIKTLYTAHNAEGGYQGEFSDPKKIIQLADLGAYEWELLDFHVEAGHSVVHKWKFNFLKAAISAADWINTVSQTYHDELLTPHFGDGLDGVFRELEQRGIFSGILNGIDKTEFDPGKDSFISEYSLHFNDVQGAIETKKRLRTKEFWKQYWLDRMIDKNMGKLDIFKAITLADPNWVDVIKQTSRINEDTTIPILGTITRIDYQKTPILLKALQTIIRPDCGFQFILMGTDGGDDNGKSYTEELKKLNRKCPDNFLFFNIFDVPFSHFLYTLFDIFVVPSIWEPCGLTQMYAINYGAPAIVRKTGGLSESIEEGVTGFRFIEDPAYSNDDGRADILGAAKLLNEIIAKVLETKKNDGSKWEKITGAGMKKDFSWDKPIEKYIEIYNKLM